MRTPPYKNKVYFPILKIYHKFLQKSNIRFSKEYTKYMATKFLSTIDIVCLDRARTCVLVAKYTQFRDFQSGYTGSAA